MTSVWYGDYVPVTYPGRILAIVLMVFGIGIFAVLTSFVAARLVGLQDDGHQDDGHRDDWEEMVEIIRGENAIMRAELAELKEVLKQQAEMDGDEA